jgi:hypothetical protein
MSRRLAAYAVVTLIIAGCSSESAQNTTSNTKPKTSSKTSSKAMKFSACMRENGVREFPDPDASGELTLDGVVNGSSLDPDAPAWDKAMSACKDLQPSGFTGTKATPKQQDARLEFAQCMRENGIEDFPDPTPDGPLIDTTRIPSAAGRGARDIPGFQAAMDACGDHSREALERR